MNITVFWKIDGISWNTPVFVDDSFNTGYVTSLVIVNGKPAISYNDSSQRDLRYVQASDADGTSWNIPETVDSVGPASDYSSLAVVNGKPAISYWHTSYTELNYVRASDVDGTEWSFRIIFE